MNKSRRQNISDKAFLVSVYIFVVLCSVVALYPLVYTLSMSISGAEHVAKNDIFFYQKDFLSRLIKWSLKIKRFGALMVIHSGIPL